MHNFAGSLVWSSPIGRGNAVTTQTKKINITSNHTKYYILSSKLNPTTVSLNTLNLIVWIDMKKWQLNFSHFKTHLKISFIDKSQLKCSFNTIITL